MPSPWTFSESEGQVRIQNLIVPIDFGLEEFCTPAQVAINNQTKITWVSVIYMQVDWSISWVRNGLSSIKISQTYTMCILQRYIVMTHREHLVKLKTSVWMLKNTDIKQCKSVNLDYTIV